MAELRCINHARRIALPALPRLGPTAFPEAAPLFTEKTTEKRETGYRLGRIVCFCQWLYFYLGGRTFCVGVSREEDDDLS